MTYRDAITAGLDSALESWDETQPRGFDLDAEVSTSEGMAIQAAVYVDTTATLRAVEETVRAQEPQDWTEESPGSECSPHCGHCGRCS